MCPDGSSKKQIAIAILFVGLAILTADGGEASRLTDLGYAALGKGDWDTALARFNEAIRATPKDPVAHHGLGLAYGMVGKLDLGIAELTEAIQLDPTEATAYRSRGSLYVFKSDYVRVIADCDEAIRRGLKDSTTYNNRGYAHLCRGSLKQAVDDLTEAIRLAPECGTKTYANRGLAWYKLRLYDRAIADLETAVRLDCTNVAALLIRASAYYHKGELDKALGDLSNAIRLNPKSTEAFRQRGSILAIRGQIDLAIADFTTAIHLDPRDPEGYLGRGNCLARQGQYDKAISDLDAAIKLKPSSPCFYEGRGAIRIGRGEYDRGIADLETAIRLNPLDMAAHFEAWPKVPVSDAALQHGRRQVRQMLLDRPAMRQYGEQAQVLYEWATRKFAGEDLGQKVFWDASPAPPHTTCANYPPTAARAGFIQVSGSHSNGRDKGKEQSFEELWHDVVFELYNIANAEDFGRLTTEASMGKLSKEEYVAKIIECESHAAEKTRSFYIHICAPLARQHHLRTRPGLWYLAQRSEPTENLFCLVEKESCSRFYERRYDLVVLHSLVAKGENQKALDLAAEMRKHAATLQERATICRYSGYCLLRLNRHSEAINAYSEAVRSAPGDCDAYLGRATAFRMLHDMDHAIADYSEAIRLNRSNAEAYALRAQAYDAIADKDRAKADYVMAKQLVERQGRGRQEPENRGEKGARESAGQSRQGVADERAR
jgi:tetratricopeptide (TPR) repeat protein